MFIVVLANMPADAETIDVLKVSISWQRPVDLEMSSKLFVIYVRISCAYMHERCLASHTICFAQNRVHIHVFLRDI